MNKHIRKTKSVCPVCLKRIPAAVYKRGEEYFLEKTCPEHGGFSTVVWRGNEPSYETWGAGYSMSKEQKRAGENCPDGCGLCPEHLQKTCCALVEVTRKCNLDCPVCFARAGGESAEPEPSISELSARFKKLVEDGNTFIQLSGGEPTVREDLPKIIAAAKDAGAENIQLNTNGLRLAQDGDYVNTLRDAGLSFVFLQFDGTHDDIYKKLRGRPLLEIKNAVIENCAGAKLGVTLVPTLVPGINCENIGDIIDFALDNSPAVRGVHFQPVSYFGRYPGAPDNADRVTLPEVLRAIEKQTGGRLKIKDFMPSRCDHPYCGFHGDFAVLPKKALLKLTPKNPAPCCGDEQEHIKNREFVSRRWKREKDSDNSCCGSDMRDMDTFLKRIKSHGFTITAMAFQDAFNLDIERLRRCSLHVEDSGRLIPFCSRYLTNI